MGVCVFARVRPEPTVRAGHEAFLLLDRGELGRDRLLVRLGAAVRVDNGEVVLLRRRGEPLQVVARLSSSRRRATSVTTDRATNDRPRVTTGCVTAGWWWWWWRCVCVCGA